MFFNKSKRIDKVNSKIDRLFREVIDLYKMGDTSEEEAVKAITTLFTRGAMTLAEASIILDPMHDQHMVNEYRFSSGMITYKKYLETKALITRNQRQDKERDDQNADLLNVYGSSSSAVRDYLRELNIIKFRLGEIDFIEYEINDADTMERPYAKVFFTPSREDNSNLNVEVRFNQHFINEIVKDKGFEFQSPDDEDEVIEQWLHTVIIVMAGNMLKETDLDFFRSLASDHPGADLIKRVEFDTEELPDDIAARFNQHGFYG